MRRRRVPAIAALLLLVGAAAGAEVSKDLTTLPYRRAVLPPNHVPAGAWLAVVEDSLLAARSSPDFHDVRLMNAAGQSVPFAVLPPRREDPIDLPVLARLLPRQHTSDTVFQVDMGPDYPETLLVEFPRRSGQESVAIRTGPDREGTVRLEPLPEALDRSHPVPPEPGLDVRAGIAAGRWLQVDFFSTGNFLPGDSLRVYRRVERAAPRLTVPFRIASRGFEGRTWRAVIELENPAGAATAVVIHRRNALSRPPMRVEARLPGGAWRFVPRLGQGSPGREANAADTFESLEFRPLRTDALRLTVSAADPPNPPLTVEGVQTVPMRWAFPASAATESLWVAYGDPYLGAQAWFLEDAANRVPGYTAAGLGPETANPLLQPPGFGLDWLRRHPPVLGVAMVIVLALVALIVFRGRTGPAT